MYSSTHKPHDPTEATINKLMANSLLVFSYPITLPNSPDRR